jgi:hypothetical protein
VYPQLCHSEAEAPREGSAAAAAPGGGAAAAAAAASTKILQVMPTSIDPVTVSF